MLFIWSMVRCCLPDLESCVVRFALGPVLKIIACKTCRWFFFFFLQNILDFVRGAYHSVASFILSLMLFSFQEHSYFSYDPKC